MPTPPKHPRVQKNFVPHAGKTAARGLFGADARSSKPLRPGAGQVGQPPVFGNRFSIQEPDEWNEFLKVQVAVDESWPDPEEHKPGSAGRNTYKQQVRAAYNLRYYQVRGGWFFYRGQLPFL